MNEKICCITGIVHVLLSYKTNSMDVKLKIMLNTGHFYLIPLTSNNDFGIQLRI